MSGLQGFVDRERAVLRMAGADVRDVLQNVVTNDLDRLALIALDFPVFRDGRAYSHARLLRERFGFDGEIRATGNVLRDQFLFMHRCGFDAFVIADPAQADAWLQSISEISVWYQPATDSRTPVLSLRHRLAAAAAE